MDLTVPSPRTGKNILHFAVLLQNRSLFELGLAAGISLQSKDLFGFTPTMLLEDLPHFSPLVQAVSGTFFPLS